MMARSSSADPIASGGGAATPVEKPKTKTDPALDRPWDVIVYNDPVNLMSFVTYALQKVFGYTEEHAHRLMMEVHRKGKSIVWSGEKEKAEFYVQQLQGFQLLTALKRAS